MIQYTKIQAYERNQPSLSSVILKTLPVGTQLDVTYIGNGWARINKPIPLAATFIATSSLTDTNPINTSWFSSFFTDTPAPTPAPVQTLPPTYTPAPTGTGTTKPKEQTKPIETPQQTPEPKNNTIWYILGGAALIGIYFIFKKKK